MQDHGWASRCRWDKGTENRLAMLEQINHWYVEGRPETLHRGSAISGKSTENCRMEMMWRWVAQHVTYEFREVFCKMRDLHIYDPSS